MTINVDDIRAEAEAELRAERSKKAKDAIKSQLRVVDSARQVLENEQRKLADLEAQIADGSL